MNDLEKIRDRIRSWLIADSEERGMTLYEVSDQTGLRRQSLYDGRNESWNPQFDTMNKLLPLVPEGFGKRLEQDQP